MSFEGQKWFIAPIVISWIAIAAWVRWRHVGSAAFNEFFFRYSIVMLLALLASQGAYFLWFGEFPARSSLGDRAYGKAVLGAFVLTAICTVVAIVIERSLQKHCGRSATP